MKTTRIIKIGNLVIVFIAFLFTLLSPGALIGAKIPSIEDVAGGKASPPTIEDLTGGKVKNTDLIDKNNVDLVKDYLMASIYANVKRGMVLRIGTQLPPEQLYPKVLREITLRNQGKAVMNENGAVYYEKIGTPWRGGSPFPVAKSGLEVMGNYNYGVGWDNFNAFNTMYYVNSRGEIYKTVGQETLVVKLHGRTMLPPLGSIPGFENIWTKTLTLSTYPLEIKGMGQFRVRYYDPEKTYDSGFAYLPAFKRTTRVSATTWQDNIAGSDLIYGDGNMFNDPYTDWNLNLVGRKFLLVPEPKSPFPLSDGNGKISERVQFDVGKKFPRIGWVIWPMYVVEATPKIKHVYGKKVVYAPIWPYLFFACNIVGTDIYDRQGRLWKGMVNVPDTYYLDGNPEKPVMSQAFLPMWDLQADHTTLYWMNKKLNIPGLGPENVTLGTLLKKGR
ncbi:MAG: DUF1329 domain-containing protein [Syntrophales bacterium]|nr:DUF1329 domain-containing protein [Syntrophales bacterium]